STVRLACLVARGSVTPDQGVAQLAEAGLRGMTPIAMRYIAVLSLGVAVLATGLLAQVRSATIAHPRQDTARNLEPQVVENRNPEALPPAAIARLGPQRFRHDSGGTGGHATAVTSDGKLLATAANSRIRLWELPSGKFLYDYFDPMQGFDRLVLSPDDKWLVGRGERPFLFDLQNRKMVCTFAAPEDTPLVFSPDSRHVLLARKKEVTWCHPHSGEIVRRWSLPEGFENAHTAL